MNHEEVGRLWNANAETWTKLVLAVLEVLATPNPPWVPAQS